MAVCDGEHKHSEAAREGCLVVCDVSYSLAWLLRVVAFSF
jgi:hypothetical protein